MKLNKDCPMIADAYELAIEAKGYKIPDDYEIDDGLKHREVQAGLRHEFTNYDDLIQHLDCDADNCPILRECMDRDMCDGFTMRAGNIIKSACYDALDAAQRGIK